MSRLFAERGVGFLLVSFLLVYSSPVFMPACRCCCFMQRIVGLDILAFKPRALKKYRNKVKRHQLLYRLSVFSTFPSFFLQKKTLNTL